MSTVSALGSELLASVVTSASPTPSPHPQAERSPPGHVLSAHRMSTSAKKSKKSPGFAGQGCLASQMD